MRRQHTTLDGYPPALLDDQLRVLRHAPAETLGQAALHTRSAAARVLLARAATIRGAAGGGGASGAGVEELVAAAHGRPGRHPDVSAMDPFALGELARVVALQELYPEDPADGLALFELVLSTFGAGRVAAAHQGLHCQLAFAAGGRQRVGELLAAYRGVPAAVRASLEVDLLNPYAGGSATPEQWLTAFRRLLARGAVWLRDASGPVFDRLETPPGERVGAAHRITTIVTTYRPGPALVTTVRSLVAQTWTHHEILVVDDGSGDEFDPVLSRVAALDPRVRVIRMPVNGGTYVARNAGLGEATGTFVTFSDSDDWSHPARLQRQVEPLLADTDLVATTSVGMRVTEDLVVTRVGWEQSRSYNLSSLMLRRRPALQRLGYLDVVRKGADAEYVERARAVFGRAAVRHLTGSPLALIRLSSTSLSSADTRPGWMHPARHAYLSAFQEWHRAIVVDGVPARRPAHPAGRVFAAPRRLSGAADAATRYDVVLAGDWSTERFVDAGRPGDGASDAGGVDAGAAAGRLRALARRGLRVAVLQLDTITALAGGPRRLDPAVQRLVNDGTVDQVLLSDQVHADLVIVRSPAALHFAPGIESLLRAGRVVVELPADPELPTDARLYASQVCVAAGRRLFGVEPTFAPAGPATREALADAPDAPPLAEVDLPGSVDATAWRLDRRGPRLDRPVLGRLCGGDRRQWRRLAETLPDSEHVDVRLLDAGGAGSGGGAGGAAGFGKAGPPRRWLVYGHTETSLRSFLFQVDFYAPVPARDTPPDADPALLHALAAGCVVVLPPRWEPVYGDAAVYCDAERLELVVRDLHARPEAFLEQSRRGQDFVLRRHGHERYAEKINALRPLLQ